MRVFSLQFAHLVVFELQWEVAVGVISRAMFYLMSTRTVLHASRLRRLQQRLDGALHRCVLLASYIVL